MEAYWAALTGLTEQGNTKHYSTRVLPKITGDPAHVEWEDLTALPVPSLVVIEHDTHDTGGWFIFRLTIDGVDAGDTWHETFNDAKDQLKFEYGETVGPLHEVPDGVDDPQAFALSQV